MLMGINLPTASSSSVLSHGEIVGMADCIGFYGLNDLKEILTVVTANPTASLGKSRPLKLQHWLKVKLNRQYTSTDDSDIRLEINFVGQVCISFKISSEGRFLKALIFT